jgi:hypothetical protein
MILLNVGDLFLCLCLDLDLEAKLILMLSPTHYSHSLYPPLWLLLLRYLLFLLLLPH